jgi:prepilin-type N-terminal cleavage/methylation domain-containing protein
MSSGKGFTLIEIAIVVAIIGILAVIAIPRFTANRRQAQDTASKQALQQLAKAQEDYYLQNQTYTMDRNALQASSGWFVEPQITIVIQFADSTSWSATATHVSSGQIFSYASAHGGLQ